MGDLIIQQYAHIKFSLQIFQAFAVGGSTLGVNFFPSLRGESLKSRPDPFQLPLGFSEQSIGRGVSLITCQDACCASDSKASKTCRVHEISKSLPRPARHLCKYIESSTLAIYKRITNLTVKEGCQPIYDLDNSASRS